jgi:hypothetical protein
MYVYVMIAVGCRDKENEQFQTKSIHILVVFFTFAVSSDRIVNEKASRPVFGPSCARMSFPHTFFTHG